MRVLFWNINGFSRDESRDKLKELLRDFKPDVFCLAEPKVHCTLNFFCRAYMLRVIKKKLYIILLVRLKGIYGFAGTLI